MGDKEKSIHFTCSTDFLEEVEEYRWQNRIASRNETMRLLIERGLEAMPVKPKKPVAGAP
jgi:hypothetical protein